ncbi:MAG TPA: class I SAM-dependent methyltransferase [Gammaproteobacteria bacterium]|jgi:SAM-dependent methyltransferase|nr:class I SAM-dependent methyltransferase [Gammaproteobacteria bacterium]
MGIDFTDGRVLIDAVADAAEVRRTLKEYEPWRHRIDFSCGASSADFQTFKPFNSTPSRKIQIAERGVGSLSGYARALDVGCNAGYNSLYLASRCGMQVLGIDYSPRHIKVATDMARLAGIESCRFMQGDAETFYDEAGFDLIVHFGTLYHLKNPVRALEAALANLRPGGMLLLETQLYGSRWNRGAAFINGLRGDKSNWWALGERTLVDICRAFGADARRISRRYHLLPRLLHTRAFFKITKPADQA